jgi:hypothetical protein
MDAATLIDCWEHGRRRHALDRALLLHAAAAPGTHPETLADFPLGERNAALLRLRHSMFGDALKSCVDCPECSERLEFALSVGALLGPTVGARTADEIVVDGQRLRLPTTRDLASISTEADESQATRKLWKRLWIGENAGVEPDYDRVARALDAADPCLDLTVELDCPVCAHHWSAPFDVPGFLWEEIDARARRLLDEVHVLAQAYSWDEARILALSDSRRNAYLQRALA